MTGVIERLQPDTKGKKGGKKEEKAPMNMERLFSGKRKRPLG